MNEANRCVVVLTCHDAMCGLMDCLASLEHQELESVGLLVIDDASHDGTQRVLAGFLERTRRFREHVVFRTEERVGLEAATRVALRALAQSHAAIVLLDAHDRLLNPHALHRMCVELERGADVAASDYVARRIGTDRLPIAPHTKPPLADGGLFCFHTDLLARLESADFGRAVDAPKPALSTIKSQLVATAERPSFVSEFFLERERPVHRDQPVSIEVATPAVPSEDSQSAEAVDAAEVADAASVTTQPSLPTAEPEATPAPEPEPEQQPEPAACDSEAVPEVEPEPLPEPEPEPKTEPEPEPEPQPEPESQPDPEPEPEPELAPDAADPESDPERDPEDPLAYAFRNMARLTRNVAAAEIASLVNRAAPSPGLRTNGVDDATTIARRELARSDFWLPAAKAGSTANSEALAIDLDEDLGIHLPDMVGLTEDSPIPSEVQRDEAGGGDQIARGRAIAVEIAECLAQIQEQDGGFLEPDHYGMECAAALWNAIDAKRFAPFIERAVEGSRRRMAGVALRPRADYHWEHILYALTSMGIELDPGLRRNRLKIVHWQLFLAVVDARFGMPPRDDILEMVHANMRPDGGLPHYNQELVDDPRISEQSHALSALLLGELAIHFRDNARAQELAKKATEFLGFIVDRRWSVPKGQRTSIGYACAFRQFVRSGETDKLGTLLDQLEQSRWDNGLYPVDLDETEIDLGQTKRRGRSRSFDSLPFLGLHLATDPAEAHA